MKPNSRIKLPVDLCLSIACRLEIQRLAVRPLCDMHIWQSCLQSYIRQWCVSCENQIMVKLQEKINQRNSSCWIQNYKMLFHLLSEAQNSSFTHCLHSCSFTVRGENDLYIFQSDKKCT